jgi:hypothetical protein
VAYETKHDLYSLGVTLLELFLWIPFVRCDDYKDSKAPLRICDIFERRALEMGEGNGGLPQRYSGDTEKLTGRPEVTRHVWINIATNELAKESIELSNIVLGCLEGGLSPIEEIMYVINEIKP